jgi:hypothetical protein
MKIPAGRQLKPSGLRIGERRIQNDCSFVDSRCFYVGAAIRGELL